jgi:hypothetical protein
MQNLKRSEKSRGVILFAFNNADTDYIKITEQTIKLVKRNLKLPVTLITGMDEVVNFEVDNLIRVESNGPNVRFSSDKNAPVQWLNRGRHVAYKLSPYDETILLDTDYLVLDDSLLTYFDTEWDYLIPDRNTNAGGPYVSERMGTYSIPFVWATVVMFRKTPKAEMLFDMVERVQENYLHYKMLYNIGVGNFRNDFAFGIADGILNGYTENPATKLPKKLLTITGPLRSLNRTVDNTGDLVFLRLKFTETAMVLVPQNLHILSKTYLLSDDFKKFVDEA